MRKIFVYILNMLNIVFMLIAYIVTIQAHQKKHLRLMCLCFANHSNRNIQIYFYEFRFLLNLNIVD